MKRSIVLLIVFLLHSHIRAQEFTVCSYNCGGLVDHYDYIRAVCKS